MENENNLSEDNNSASDESSETEDGCSCEEIRQMVLDRGWCGVHSRTLPAGPFLEWPPKPAEVANGSWKSTLRQTGGPNFGNRMQLYSKNNFNLAVNYDKVYGTQDDNDMHTYLELVNAGRPGSVRIFGMLSRMYVAMDKKGRLYVEANQTNATVFEEAPHGLYNTYLSLQNAHNGWYLGLKKSGKFKNGKKTGHKQKSCLFLPRRGKFQ